MKIKNQLRISILAFSIILVIIAGSIIFTQQQTAQLEVQETLAHDIQTRASNLAYISNDYFQNKQTADLTAWENQYSGILNDLSQLKSTNAEQTKLINNVKVDAQSSNSIFNESVAYILSIPQNESGVVHPVLKTNANRMSVQTQALAFDAQQLSQSIRSQVDQASFANLILIVAALGLFGAYFITNYLITYRKTLKSISELQSGIAEIGSGNLDYSLRVDKKDEIGEVSIAVNQMAANLKTVTASKADLEREMSERKKAEEQTNRSQKTFYDLVERAPFGIYIVDSQFRISHMNIGSQNGAFRNVRPLIGRSFSEAMHILWPDNVAEEIISHFRQTLETGEPYYSPRFTNPRHDIENVESYEWELHGINLPDGQKGVICYYFDSTKLREAESKIHGLLEVVQQEKDKLSSLINSIPDEVWFADTNKKFTLANPSAAKEFGLSSLDTNDVSGIAASFEVCRADGSPRSVDEAPPLRSLKGEFVKNEMEIVNTPGSGERRYRQVSSAPVRDSKGNTIGSVSVVRDITEIKKTEEALWQAREELQRHARDLEQLVEERTKQLKDAERLAAIGATAGMVGHDIRNPLQAITSDLYLAKTELSDLPDNESKANAIESLDGIQANIDYINKIVQDLQDFARSLDPHAEEANIQSIVNDVLASREVPENIVLTVNVEKQAQLIVADPDFIKRMADNLILNAIQAMPNGGKLIVEAKKDKGTADVVFTVEDTGVGIPDEVKSKLFTPMFTTKSKGQGFGLAVVKRMAEALGGTVAFESENGKGTKFIVRLPPPQRKLNGKWVYK